MKVLNQCVLLILLTGCLLSGTSCGKKNSDTDPTLEQSDIYVTIQSVDVSLDDLKANDYTIPVYVTLDKNPGVNYTEWGVSYDSRCIVEATSDDLDVHFKTVASVNQEKQFIWTAWASGNEATYPGTLLKLNVTLPEDASLGDTYPITYADVSAADKPHVWNGSEAKWATTGTIGWQDGGITIAESSTFGAPPLPIPSD